MIRRVLGYLAGLQNSIIKDYVSEKVYDGILAGTVSVYRGAASVDRVMPAPGATATNIGAGVFAIVHAKTMEEPHKAELSSPQVSETDEPTGQQKNS